MRFVPDLNQDECLKTFKQITDSLDEQAATLMGKAALEYGVPEQCLAGVYARLMFMQEDPGTVLRSPSEFVRNVLSPLRRGYGTQEGRNQKIVEYTSQMMTAVKGRPYDFAVKLQKAKPVA